MSNELHISYGEELKIQQFRLNCLKQGIVDGIVWEEGIPYYLNEYAVFTGGEPKTLVDNGRMISEIVKLQIKKRKESRESA